MSDFFKYSNNFWEKTTPFDSHNVQQNHYSILRIVSFHRDGIYIAALLNTLPHLPAWAVAGTLYYGLPKRRAIPKRLPKKLNKKPTKKQQAILDKICAKFNVGEFHGQQIVRILSKHKINFGI
jgi:hypothetical protein